MVFAYSLLPAERLNARSLLGVVIGFVGVVVLVVPEIIGSPVGTWPGPLFLFLAFVSAAIGTVALRRIGRGPQGLWQIGVQFAVGALLGIVALALPVPEALPLSVGVWAALAALVVFSSVMGYFVYFQLHHRVGPVQANIVAYLVPLVGVAIGSGFFAEPITLSEVAGFLIVIGGVTLVIRDLTSVRRSNPTEGGEMLPAADQRGGSVSGQGFGRGRIDRLPVRTRKGHEKPRVRGSVPSPVHWHCIAHGRVQGVNYRARVAEAAARHGVVGAVMNRPDWNGLHRRPRRSRARGGFPTGRERSSRSE